MSSTAKVLILEDDADRVARFTAVLKQLDLGAPRVWRCAYTMSAEVGACLAGARLIALDHDLLPESSDSIDPGDGQVVARTLAGLPSVCPVIVHSSNSFAAQSMVALLTAAGWSVRRVLPWGENWIEHDWRASVVELLNVERC